jgi:hypothetical protein
MSQKKRKRSHRLYGRTPLRWNVVDEIGIWRTSRWPAVGCIR